jgi:hypothetical protein
MTMAIETDTVTLPAYWACGLINGDVTGMTDDEIARMSSAVDKLLGDGWEVVSMAEDSERFTWSYRLYDPLSDVEGGDVADYVVLRAA